MLISDLDEWQRMEYLAEKAAEEHMHQYFLDDPERCHRYSVTAAGITLDYSKNRITDEVVSGLMEVARAAELEQKRDAMISGQAINTTEQRAALHTLLRNAQRWDVQHKDVSLSEQVIATQQKMQSFTNSVLSGERRGYTGKAFTDVIAIGIGGSFLGPKIITEALKPYQGTCLSVHFVANVDGCHLQDVMNRCDAETTLVVMSSKSFTTQETLLNTSTAKQWFLAQGGTQEDIAKHFVCVSNNVNAAVQFGISEHNIFPMSEWVGGRYSLWSAIGLPICLAIGYDHFNALLEGAAEMDAHFIEAPLEQNMPVIMALLGIWYRNFFHSETYAILPYYHYLRGFPAYVQQLDMESNGKAVTAEGEPVDYPTGPIVFGSEGTNGQHSFHQLIHQSDTIVPVDFIFPLKVPHQLPGHHAALASNCFGQAQALMQGKPFDECLAELSELYTDEKRKNLLAHHKTMPGNKPSNMLLIDELTPKRLGALIALYEHKVFTQGAIWGLNSFDQWGVELGKQLGKSVLKAIEKQKITDQFDSSTASLIAAFLHHQ